MKGFTKIVLILAAFSFLFGTAITVAAASLGGRMPEAVAIKNGWEDGEWFFFSRGSSRHGEHNVRRSDDVEQDIREAQEYTQEKDGAAGEALYELEADMNIDAVMSSVGCSKVEISAEAVGLEIVEGDTDGAIYLMEAGNLVEWEQEVDDDTLEITVRRKNKGFSSLSWDDDGAQAVLVIPAGEAFHEMKIQVGAGRVTAGPFTVSKLELDAGAGSIIVDSGEVQELSIDCEAGFIEYAGKIGQKLEADCQAGNVELYLTGHKKEFNYELEVSMGNIQIDGEAFTSIDTEKFLPYEGAVKKAELECEMGNIEIHFSEE